MYQIIFFQWPFLVPCPANKHLMSSSLGLHMNNWSKCTKKMVSHAYHLRKENNENCFYAWIWSWLIVSTACWSLNLFFKKPIEFIFYMYIWFWYLIFDEIIDSVSVIGSGCARKTNDKWWMTEGRKAAILPRLSQYHQISTIPLSLIRATFDITSSIISRQLPLSLSLGVLLEMQREW